MKSLKELQPDGWNVPLNAQQYCAEINRNNPTAIVIMIDQSYSMTDKTKYKGQYKSYAQIVAEMVNDLLNELIGRCTKSEGVRDYFDVCVVGYGGSDHPGVEILWDRNLKGKDWVSVSDLKENAMYEKRMVSKNIRGNIMVTEEEVPYWFKAIANNGTPMGRAFVKVHELISNWIKNGHEESYPPVVINITDGMQTDMSEKDLIQQAQKLQALNTKDGHVLVLNCHISRSGQSTMFPLSVDELPGNTYARQLFEMSSVMPESYARDISALRHDKDILKGYKGMAFNANMDVLLSFIDIGTSGSLPRLI
jgi:hypothetical protein